MCLTADDSVVAPDVVAAARELIRSEGDVCVVPVSVLLDEVSGKFERITVHHSPGCPSLHEQFTIKKGS